jgi:hypothetical protein
MAMNKLIVGGAALVVCLGTVFADPKKPDKPGTTEKAGSNESLQQGGDVRPWANGVSPEQIRVASQAFTEGNAQLNDGIFTKAVEKYREALKSWDHPAIHYNLALALMNLDQPVEVYGELEKAIQYGAAPLEKDKYEHAKEYMKIVEGSIAQIEVSCAKRGAKVSVDGKEVFVAPGQYKARVRIGKHTFVAEKQGYNAQIDAPFVGPGEHFRIELKLYTHEELTRYKRRWDTTWMPYAVMGGGVVFGLVGGVLELSAKSSYDNYDKKVAACVEASPSGACEDAKLTSLKDSGDTKRALGFIGYAAAGAALAAGGVLLYLNREHAYQISADEHRRELQRSGVSAAVVPYVAPGAAGALVQGRF